MLSQLPRSANADPMNEHGFPNSLHNPSDETQALKRALVDLGLLVFSCLFGICLLFCAISGATQLCFHLFG